MLVIRLKRIGKKGKPTYRIVVAEKTMAVGGKFLHDLGYYDPHTKKIEINKDELMKYLDNGAMPSNTVSRLLVGQKVKHNLVNFVKSAPSAPKKAKEEPKAPVAPKVEVTEETTEVPAEEAAETPAEEITPETVEEVAEEVAPEVSEETPEETTETA